MGIDNLPSPLVSIFCMTYNHENYIRQCLNGFVMQLTTFSFEILVHEDASTDNTAKIVKEFEAEYPHLFRCVFQTVNQFTIQNTLTKILFPMSRGKYIALCEGDDYWTDPYKLQKQVEFLEANEDFAICFHNSKIINENEPDKICYSNTEEQKEITVFEELARGEYIYTATCVFRMENFKKFPLKYYQYINNYTIDLHNAQFGKIKYMNEVMSVYRIHPGGIWSMVPRITTLINQLPVYKFYIKYFDKKYYTYFITHVRNMTKEIILLKLKEKDLSAFWEYYFQYLYYNFSLRQEWKTMLISFLRALKIYIN